MDCNEFLSLLEKKRDGEISAADQARMEAHADTCERCRMALDLAGLNQEEEVPPLASARWRAAVRQEERVKVTPIQKKFAWKQYLSVAAAVIFIAVGAATVHQSGPTVMKKSAAPESEMAVTSEYDAGAAYMGENIMPALRMAAEDTAIVAQAADDREKIIRTVSLTVKTNAFDDDLALLKTLAKEQGGRVESERVSGDQASGALRNAAVTLRIPADALDSFLSGAQGVSGRVTSSSQTSEDVSDTYYDVKSRLDTQQAKMARLKDLMAKAETVSDLIELENAVTDTQYLIDSYTGQLNGYDDKVKYSTVSLSLAEERVRDTAEDTALTFGQRVAKGFQDTLSAIGVFVSDAAVFLVIAAPWLLIAAALITLVTLISRHNRKRKTRKEEKKDV